MVNETLNNMFDIDPGYKLCPKCGVVEPCLVHQPLPEGVHAGDIITYTPQDLVANTISISIPGPAPLPEEPSAAQEQLEADFEEARTKIKDAMTSGRNATGKALELAESGDSPRAYEVVGTLITATVNASKELVNLHKSKKDIKTPSSSTPGTPGTINIDKAVFVGRASELIRELVNAKKPQELPKAEAD